MRVNLRLVFMLYFLPVLAARADLWEKITDPTFWNQTAAGIPVEGFAVTILALLFDTVLRTWKTEKPKSILRGLAVIFLGLARVLERAARFLDKLVGQNAILKGAAVVPPKPATPVSVVLTPEGESGVAVVVKTEPMVMEEKPKETL